MTFLLATEGPLLEHVPSTHIAAKLALPLGILVFCGSVYLLLWSIYGAKKGALIYGTAFFGFTMLLGVYWWFGAPGTPVATGLQNFPGQAPDHYQPKWFGFEAGSERASFFPLTREGFEAFQTPAEYLGKAGVPPEQLDEDPMFRALVGDLEQAANVMLAQFLPTNELGAPLLGANRRQRIEQEIQRQGGTPPGKTRASPFLTARVATDEQGEPLIRVADDAGHRVAAAKLELVANFVNADPDLPPDPVQMVVEERTWFAFKDPGALWFPSAVWTVVSAVLFAGCLWGLDRIEQREKREREAAETPADADEPLKV